MIPIPIGFIKAKSGFSGTLDNRVISLLEADSILYAIDSDGSLYDYTYGPGFAKLIVGGFTVSVNHIKSIVFGTDIYICDGYNLYEYNGVSSWVSVGAISSAREIIGIEVFNSNLYVIDDDARLYEWNGTDTLTSKTSTISTIIDDTVILANYVNNAKLYATVNGGMYEWNGTNAWINKISQDSDVNSMNNYIEVSNELYVCGNKQSGTFGEAQIWKWDGSASSWTESTEIGLEVVETATFYPLIYFNSKMLTGINITTGNNAMWNVTSFNAWSEVSGTNQGEIYANFINFDSMLLAGLNNGNVINYTNKV